MAGLKGITVNTAPEAEPHIYAEDDAAIFQSIFGEDGVSSIGQACKATVLSNNKVRIADGVVFVGGHFARIPYGEYVDCEIANGQSGKNRNDIIVAKFVTTGSGGIDTMTCEVKQGTAGTTAADPALTQNDIYKGGKIREFPLYRVKIEGLNITAVEQLFTVVPTNEEMIKTVAELNGKIADKMYRTKVLLKYYDSHWMYATINVGKQFAGSVPIASLVYQSGTAAINVVNISAEQVKDDGNVTIWAYGSGFVSAHLLYVMIDCRSD